MSRNNCSLTQAELRSKLRYCPASGLFSWSNPTTTAVSVGSLAGSPTGKGYIRIRLNGRNYAAHRLAMLYIYGEMPAVVDHKDGVITNNALDNLRSVSLSENAQNRKRANRNNRSTGLAGVSPQGSRFRAAIYYDGRTHIIGQYDTAEEAHAAYLAEKLRVHSGFVPLK